MSGTNCRVVGADALEGDRVVNPRGDDLGTIEDIVVDVQRGAIAYALVSRGAFPGIRDKLLAIPWNALTLDTGGDCFTLDAVPEDLDSAPAFDKAEWPAMADARWASEVHDYYGVRPYWRADTPGKR